MSRTYLISTRLDAEFNESNIQAVLERGLPESLIYYKYMDEDGTPLNINEATDSAFKGDKDWDVNTLAIKVEDTYAKLIFSMDKNNMMNVMLSGLSHLWFRKFKNGDEDIDVARYAKVLLNLTQDFKILEMNIDKD